jgi:tetratricopeptide (TPR) repeat protein
MNALDALAKVNVLMEAKQYQKALTVLESVLGAEPANLDALECLRQLLDLTGHYAAAVQWLIRFLENNPQAHHGYSLLGYVMCKLGQFEAGIECFDQALALAPQDVRSTCERATALSELGQHAQALAGYNQALALDPVYADAHVYRGSSLLALGQPDAAIASFDSALTLNPSMPSAFVNRGNAYMQKDAYAMALADYEQAIDLQSSNVLAHSNRAVALKHLHRHHESLVSSNTAIRLDSNYLDAQFNLALSQLLCGDLEQGFRSYQVRWKTAKFAPTKRQFQQALWLGDAPIAGKRLLVHNEQGLGDSIQFCRFVTSAAQAGAQVIYEVEAPLYGLMQSLGGVHTLVRQREPLPPFDYYCPVMSLPVALGTRLDNIPAPTPYLRAPAAKLLQWKQRLGTAPGPRIGLVWSGSPNHKGDRHRSIAFGTLLKALPLGPHYISLQKELRQNDATALAQVLGLQHFGDEIVDFSDTAALCTLMDLVIAVDTSIAHLAGALGTPTWLLLPHLPDWRWLLDRSDTPWYPQMRLFRQENVGDWGPVFDRVHAQIASKAW